MIWFDGNYSFCWALVRGEDVGELSQRSRAGNDVVGSQNDVGIVPRAFADEQEARNPRLQKPVEVVLK